MTLFELTLPLTTGMSVQNTFEGYSECVLLSGSLLTRKQRPSSVYQRTGAVLVWYVPTLDFEHGFRVLSLDPCSLVALSNDCNIYILGVSRDGVTNLEYNLRRTHQDPFPETLMAPSIGS